MTKSELISQVAADTGVSKVDIQKVVESVISTIIKSLKKEPRFPVFGLGIFEVVKRPKRKGRNPRTGEPLTVKAHKAVKFKAAKVFKDAVNNPVSSK
jgi:DNA-binding protein HU-beta